MENPWGLSPRESEAMDAVCALGCQKLACERLGLSLKTLQTHTSRAGQKMGIDMHIKKYITWHDWMQRRATPSRY